MGLTTERKVFFGLMVIAGASLIVDQTILSPQSASAGSLDVQQVESLPAEPILAGFTVPESKSITKILNDRLSSSADLGTQESANQMMQQMFSSLVKPVQQAESVSMGGLALPSIDPVSEQSHSNPTNMPVLSAVMPSRKGSSGAILDATLYRIGQTTTSGYRVLDVQQRTVLVEYKGREYWLTLPAFED